MPRFYPNFSIFAQKSQKIAKNTRFLWKNCSFYSLFTKISLPSSPKSPKFTSILVKISYFNRFLPVFYPKSVILPLFCPFFTKVPFFCPFLVFFKPKFTPDYYFLPHLSPKLPKIHRFTPLYPTFFVIESTSVAISTQIIGFTSILTLLAYFTSFLR